MNAPSPEVLNLVTAVVSAAVALSVALGAVDLIRQPGWAWKAAGEPRTICLLLILLLPGVGLAIYVFGVRPRVVAVAAVGRAATLPFERFADRANLDAEDTRSIEILAAPATFASFGEPRVTPPVRPTEKVVEAPARGGFFEDPDVLTIGAAAEFFETGVLVTAAPREPLTINIPGAMGRPYRPVQRASLDESDQSTSVAARVPDASSDGTVRAASVARWMSDPTGRHQYRYWDGNCWTDSVSDAGVESRDPGIG
ncbi:MAG: DUF2510 domain-containing protein [Acidimicrobiales bacterium]|jgi:hypothetical protein